MFSTIAKWLAAPAAILAIAFADARGSSTVIDLTTAGNSSAAAPNGGLDTAAFGGTFVVQQSVQQPAGSGVFNSFVRIQQTGNEAGYNTSAALNTWATNSNSSNNLPFSSGTTMDDLNHSGPGPFISALKVSDIPIVWFDASGNKLNAAGQANPPVGSVAYREFLLDINESNSATKTSLSVNQLQIFLGQTGNLTATGYTPPTNTTAPTLNSLGSGANAATQVFRLNDNTNPSFYEIKLLSNNSSGSGSSDMSFYVKDSVFDTTKGNYVYLFSQFGAPPGSYASQGGYEEWGVQSPTSNPTTPTPEPTTIALALSGLGALGLGGLRRRLSRKHEATA